MNRTRHLLAASALMCVFGLVSVPPASAQEPIPYPNSGTVNATTYTFTAISSQDVIAYFAGSTAGYDNELGLLVNGVSTGVIGLDDHTSTIGQSLDLGPVHAGDVLTFVMQNNSLGKNAYSDPILNVAYDDPGYTGSHNHIYSTGYTGAGGNQPIYANIPAGTYVAFEDIPFPGSNFNYFDENFIFTNVTTNAPTTPEPGAYALFASMVLTGAAFLRRGR